MIICLQIRLRHIMEMYGDLETCYMLGAIINEKIFNTPMALEVYDEVSMNGANSLFKSHYKRLYDLIFEMVQVYDVINLISECITDKSNFSLTNIEILYDAESALIQID